MKSDKYRFCCWVVSYSCVSNDVLELPPISDLDIFVAIKPLRRMKSVRHDDIPSFNIK